MEELIATFLAAFENLDLPGVIACFGADATAFLVPPEPNERCQGREAIQAQLANVFAAIRVNATEGPPFHRLIPLDLRIEELSPGLGLATFHLRNAERMGRRTLVLRRDPEGWRIQHLHASNIPVHR